MRTCHGADGTPPVKNYILAEIGPNRKPYNILIDSGACISVTTKKVVEREKLQLLPLEPNEQGRIKSANNSTQQIIGKTWMEVSIGDVQISVLCHVVPTLVTSILFGCDMLAENDACVDFVKQELHLFNGKLSVPMTHNMRQNGVAYLKYEQIIPARTEKTIAFRASERMKNSAKQHMVQVGPNHRVIQDSGLGVANSVAVVDRGWVKARILNPWDYDIKLQRNKHYVTVTEIKEGEMIVLPQEEDNDDVTKKAVAENRASHSPTIATVIEQTPQEIVDQLGVKFDDDIDPNLKRELIQVISEYPDVFAKSYADIREGSLLRPAEIKITPNSVFERNKIYRVSPKTRQIQAKLVDELLDAGILEETKEIVPFLNNLLLVKKPDGSHRLCIDLRHTNKYTDREDFKIPLIEDLFLSVATHQGQEICYTLLDLYSAYNQLFLEEESRKYTAVLHPDGNRVLVSTRVVMGAKNSVSSYQRRISEIFQSIDPLKILIYVDDLLCISSKKEHPQLLRQIFEILRKYHLKMSGRKAMVARSSVKYMGYKMTSSGICVDEDRIKALQLIKAPKDLHQTRVLLGQFAYFSKMIPNYHIIIDPIRKLLKKDQKFEWSKEAHEALEEIKNQLARQVMLSHADTSRGFLIAVDSSRKGIGYCVMQEDLETKQYKPIAFGGRGLTEHERNKLGVTELELTGLAHALQKNRVLLNNGCKHIVETDHISNTYIQSLKKAASGRLARLYLLISEYNLETKYVPGKRLGGPDCLSRAYEDTYVPEKDDEDDEILNEVVVTAVETKTTEIAEETQPPEESIRTVNDPVEDQDPIEEDHLEDKEVIVVTPWEDVTNEASTTDNQRSSTLQVETEDIRTEQRKDKDLLLLIQYIEEEKLPEDKDLAKKVVSKSEFYVLTEDGVLGRMVHNSKKLQDIGPLHETIVIPVSMQERMVRETHEALAHRGAEQVYATLIQRWFFENAFTKIKKYLRNCPTCLRTKINKAQRRQPLQRVPFEGEALRNWSMDAMTLPESPSAGVHQVMVAIDQQTRWVEVFMLKSADAPTLSTILMELIARHGTPSTLRMDRAASQLSVLFQQLCKGLGIKTKVSSSYWPQSDGMVERANQAILEGLRAKLVQEKDWAIALPYVLMALRASVSSATGFSAYELAYGRKFVLPHEAGLLQQNRTEWPLYAREYVGEVQERIERLNKVARKNSEQAQEQYKDAYDKRFRAVSKPAFKTGELVLLRTLQIPSDARRKLVPAYRGVYRVDRTVRADVDCHTYIITDMQTGKQHPHPINEYHLRRYSKQDDTMFTNDSMFQRNKLDDVPEESEQDITDTKSADIVLSKQSEIVPQERNDDIDHRTVH